MLGKLGAEILAPVSFLVGGVLGGGHLKYVNLVCLIVLLEINYKYCIIVVQSRQPSR